MPPDESEGSETHGSDLRLLGLSDSDGAQESHCGGLFWTIKHDAPDRHLDDEGKRAFKNASNVLLIILLAVIHAVGGDYLVPTLLAPLILIAAFTSIEAEISILCSSTSILLAAIVRTLYRAGCTMNNFPVAPLLAMWLLFAQSAQPSARWRPVLLAHAIVMLAATAQLYSSSSLTQEILVAALSHFMGLCGSYAIERQRIVTYLTQKRLRALENTQCLLRNGQSTTMGVKVLTKRMQVAFNKVGLHLESAVGEAEMLQRRLAKREQELAGLRQNLDSCLRNLQGPMQVLWLAIEKNSSNNSASSPRPHTLANAAAALESNIRRILEYTQMESHSSNWKVANTSAIYDDAATATTSTTVVDINQTIAEAVSYATALCGTKHKSTVVIKHVPLSPGINGTHIQSQPSWLLDNVLCLLSNAIRRNVNGGVVTVSASVEPKRTSTMQQAPTQMLRISVEDCGLGTTPASTKAKSFGTSAPGIDLWVLSKRIECLTGECGVTARPDGRPGSVHYFTMPYRPHAIAAPQQQAVSTTEATANVSELEVSNHDDPTAQVSSAGMHESGKMHILLADDSSVVLKTLGRALEQAGFKVTTAENGQVALDKINRNAGAEFDVVLSDLQMPVMDGLELCNQLSIGGSGPNQSSASSTKDLAFFLMSSNAYDDICKAAVGDYKVHAILEKPFSVATFQILLAQQSVDFSRRSHDD